MQFNIKKDDLKDGKVLVLLEAHHQEMQLYSPPESIHALNKKQYFDPDLTFWGAWNGVHLAACGALKQLTDSTGEVKAMRTAKKYIRQGLAAKILATITAEARDRNYLHLYLETGVHEAFLPAVRLYEKNGFTPCEPFGEYQLDPHSQFLSLNLIDN